MADRVTPTPGRGPSFSADEHAAVSAPRGALCGLDAQQAIELLPQKAAETSSNAEFLLQVRRSGHPGRVDQLR